MGMMKYFSRDRHARKDQTLVIHTDLARQRRADPARGRRADPARDGVFTAASSEHPDITVGKVDTEDQPGLSAAACIGSIPTLMAFRDGILVFSQPGALPAAALEQVIQAVRDLDRAEVHRKPAQREAEASR